jgi:two-component system, NtrC family, response regulator AtoC
MNKEPVEEVVPLGFELLVSCAAEVLTVNLVPGREYTVGRDTGCDIPIDETTVSRVHARIAVSDAVTITDLGSSNGTSIGGQRLTAREPVKVAVGAVVELGQATLLLQRVRARESRPAVARASLAQGSNPSRVVVDPTMRNLYSMLDVVAPSQIAVLILGETGVGKEVVAAEVHRRSRRASAPFIPMNCAALPDSILEAELFGYEKGAFTGANQAKVGLFEAANGGTIFLDEIGDMPLTTQAKVLRALESGEILRLGSVKPRHVDVRFIAATNRDIPQMIDAGRFRADLFFRLNGVTLTVPPLRRRRTEIVPLATMFVELAASRHGRLAPVLSPEAAARLVDMPWPGNVRQLRSTIERAVVMCNGSILRADHLDDGTDSHVTPVLSATTMPVPAMPRAPTTADTGAPTERMRRDELDAASAQRADAPPRGRARDARPSAAARSPRRAEGARARTHRRGAHAMRRQSEPGRARPRDVADHAHRAHPRVQPRAPAPARGHVMG